MKRYYESDNVHVSGLIVSEYAQSFHHYEAKESLGDFLKKEKIPALTGIDTRALTEHIREYGAVPAKIVFDHLPDTLEFSDPNERLLAYEVGTKDILHYTIPEIPSDDIS
jgi:carbamoylphosphate synthase small subunit